MPPAAPPVECTTRAVSVPLPPASVDVSAAVNSSSRASVSSPAAFPAHAIGTRLTAAAGGGEGDAAGGGDAAGDVEGGEGDGDGRGGGEGGSGATAPE